MAEYFLFDPEQEYLEPPPQGFRLEGGEYSSIPADAAGALTSQQLDLRLSIGDGRLQFHRLDNGERLLTRAERIERAGRQAEQVAAAHRAAEEEIARLRAELAQRPPIA